MIKNDPAPTTKLTPTEIQKILERDRTEAVKAALVRKPELEGVTVAGAVDGMVSTITSGGDIQYTSRARVVLVRPGGFSWQGRERSDPEAKPLVLRDEAEAMRWLVGD